MHKDCVMIKKSTAMSSTLDLDTLAIFKIVFF